MRGASSAVLLPLVSLRAWLLPSVTSLAVLPHPPPFRHPWACVRGWGRPAASCLRGAAAAWKRRGVIVSSACSQVNYMQECVWGPMANLRPATLLCQGGRGCVSLLECGALSPGVVNDGLLYLRRKEYMGNCFFILSSHRGAVTLLSSNWAMEWNTLGRYFFVSTYLSDQAKEKKYEEMRSWRHVG